MGRIATTSSPSKHISFDMKSALMVLFLVAPFNVWAVSLTGRQTAPNEWTYTLTFDPLDNYSICQPTTTITLTGLFHVVSATAPTSTDLPGTFFDQINTNWIPEVLAGGSGVRWTHVGPGTGNWDEPRQIYGFRVIANDAINGSVFLSTSGVSLDVSTQDNLCGVTGVNRDIASSVDGPVDAYDVAVSLSVQNLHLTNGFAITVIGTPGFNYILQAASVLPTTNWNDVLSFTLFTSITNIVDATATNFPVRFYRAKSF